jgi:hypothetical protein
MFIMLFFKGTPFVPIQGVTCVSLIEAIHCEISFTLIPRSNISEVFCNLEPVLEGNEHY